MSTAADQELLVELEAEILRLGGGIEQFRTAFARLLRASIDSVIDTLHTGRCRFKDLEKTEKTYLGTKVEIRFRHLLGASKGKVLDLNLCGREVDIKNTVGSQWTIPPEATGHPCILIRSDELRAIFSIGLIVIREEWLNKGKNRDLKCTVCRDGMNQIRWILRDEPYPKNFWETLDESTRGKILQERSGTKRLAQLFRLIQSVAIPRQIVDGLAQQKDSMKRLRKNGGARDRLKGEGIVILSGASHSGLIRKLQLPECSKSEFISFCSKDEEVIGILREAGEL